MKYEEQAYNRILKNELRYERQILNTLSRALDDIAGKMSRIYESYAINGKLTKAEMTRYNRYAQMEKNIFIVVNDATKLNIKDIDRMLPEQYNEAFFNYAWAMDNANGVRINYGVVNKDILAQLNKNPWLISAKERYYVAGMAQIRNALNDGLDLGISYTRMYSQLKTAVDRLKFEIIRVLRTEGQTVINAGQTDLYARAIKAGIKGKEIWDATLDGRTRPTKKGAKGNHREMDGKEKGADGFFFLPFTGEKAPYPAFPGLSAGQRINCRCRSRFQVEGYEPIIRRARDRGIIPYQTYEDWLPEYKRRTK